MSALLYLVHRIPFPPDKGDKIRSFHLLQALRSRYEIYLGTFVDAEEDERHLPALRELCTELFVARLHPRRQRLASGRALFMDQPLTNMYYSHRALADWVKRTLDQQAIERIVVFSSSMGQFVSPTTAAAIRCVIDFCDIDSDKWRQYAQRHRWPLSAVFAREAGLLQRTEIELARRFAASVFVSNEEANVFRKFAGVRPDCVHAVRNGVDAAYFDPEKPVDATGPPAGPYVVFTGAMDYWANVEGVSWFVREVWPAVRSLHPDTQLLIVGSRPTRAVLQLAKTSGVVVTGGVPDVRPYIRAAHVSVAPLRIARGIQNKVLEAMAMGRHIVATPAAIQGIDAPIPPDVRVEHSPDGFAQAVAARLGVPRPAFSVANRNFVQEHYDWAINLRSFMELVAGGVPASRGSPRERAGESSLMMGCR